MVSTDRRSVLAVACLSRVLSAVLHGESRADSCPNDARLYALADRWVALAWEQERMCRISHRRWDVDDPHDGPLAARLAEREARADDVLREIAAIPADTAAGMDAKWRVHGYVTEPLPGPEPPFVVDTVVRAAHADAARLGVAAAWA